MTQNNELKIEFLINSTARKIYVLAKEVYDKHIEVKQILEEMGAFGMAFVDGKKKRIYIDESLVNKEINDETLEAFGYILYHEILHHELRHFGRFPDLLENNPTLSNLVLDLFINNIVNKVFTSQIDKYVTTFENLLSNEIITEDDYKVLIYASEDELFEFFNKDQEINQALKNLQQEIDNLFDNNSNNNSNSNSNNNSNNNSDNSNNGENSDFESEMKKFSDKVKEAVENAKNKSSGKGKKLLEKYGQRIASDYISKKIQEALGNEDDYSPSNKIRAKEVIKKLGEYIKKKGHGLGDRLLEFVDEKIPITMHKMLRFIEKTYGYSNRKMIYPKKSVYYNTGTVLPKRKDHGIVINFIIDTSLSMSDEEIQKILAIVRYMLSLGNEIIARFHSVESQEVRIRNAKEMENYLKNPVVSGGSDFTNAFKKEDIGFFYSDLDIDYDFSNMPPNGNLIVIVPKNHNSEVRKEFEKHYMVVDIDRIK